MKNESTVCRCHHNYCRKKPGAKPMQVEGLVLEFLGLKGGGELSDFPSVAELKTKFTSIKNKNASQKEGEDCRRNAGSAPLEDEQEKSKSAEVDKPTSNR